MGEKQKQWCISERDVLNSPYQFHPGYTHAWASSLNDDNLYVGNPNIQSYAWTMHLLSIHWFDASVHLELLPQYLNAGQREFLYLVPIHTKYRMAKNLLAIKDNNQKTWQAINSQADSWTSGVCWPWGELTLNVSWPWMSLIYTLRISQRHSSSTHPTRPTVSLAVSPCQCGLPGKSHSHIPILGQSS